MKKYFLLLIVIFILLAGLSYFQKKNSPSSDQPIQKTTTGSNSEIPRTSVVAENLDTPWGLVFLPDNSMLVTERDGRVRLIDKSGKLEAAPILEISVVKKIQGEGGLHGITIHPEFEKNNFVYLYYTYENRGNQSLNRVSRFVFDGGKLNGEKILVDKIPGALFHDGGRIKFGPDKFLYITTGDAQEPSLAQNKNSLAGKILRVSDEGKPAPGNPFGNLIYSYGHRNPQGISWDDRGNLWETEHGSSARDELNLIEIGKNYGWPEIVGDERQAGMQPPILHSSSSKTWAPAGMSIVNNTIYFAGLRGQALYKVVIENKKVTSFNEFFTQEYGRIRDVVLGPDGMIYIATSNRDGRGSPRNADDRIIKINPDQL